MSEPAPAPAPAPILYHEGQPITAEAAAATRASLLGNADYVKEALAGDVTKQKHLAALWQLERGIQPPPPETIEQAEQQIGDRLERDRLMHASALHSSAEFSPEAVDQIVGQRPIPAQGGRLLSGGWRRCRRTRHFADATSAVIARRPWSTKQQRSALVECQSGRSIKSAPGKPRTRNDFQDRACQPPPTEVNPQHIALAALLEIANSGKRLQRLRAIAVLMEYANRQRSEAGLVSG
jgi:hypothetical protein